MYEHYWPCTQPCSTAHLVFSDLCTNKFPFINSYDNLELRLCLKLSVCWMPWLISLKLPLVYLLSICCHSFLLFLLSYFPILHSSSEFPLKVGKKKYKNDSANPLCLVPSNMVSFFKRPQSTLSPSGGQVVQPQLTLCTESIYKGCCYSQTNN